jgi:preprotein translocase subunit SecG
MLDPEHQESSIWNNAVLRSSGDRPYSPSPMQILINCLLAIYVLVALLMVLVILMQRPKSEGLGAAFGGGVTENIFGAQTTNVLVKFTAWLTAMFFILTFVLSILYSHKTSRDTGLRNELLRQQTTSQPSASVPPANPNAPAVPAPGAPVLPQSSASSSSTAAPPIVPSASPAPSKPKGESVCRGKSRRPLSADACQRRDFHGYGNRRLFCNGSSSPGQ